MQIIDLKQGVNSLAASEESKTFEENPDRVDTWQFNRWRMAIDFQFRSAVGNVDEWTGNTQMGTACLHRPTIK